MRVAFVVGEFPKLSETFILDQMTGLIDRGHEVMIFARPPNDSRAPHDATVDEHGLIGRTFYWEGPRRDLRAVGARTRDLLVSRPLRTVADMARTVRRLHWGDNVARLWSRVTMARTAPRPDVILAHFGPNAVLAHQLREIGVLRAPLAAVFHGYDLSKRLRESRPDYYRDLFDRAELKLPISRYFQERLISLGCPPETIQVHRMGVEPERFDFRARSVAPGGSIRFVSVCRLVEKKGLETGFHAFARFRGEFPSATWQIIGDGPLRKQLEGIRQSLSLSDGVVLHGALPREQVRRFLDESHVLLAPSVTALDGDQEGIPVSIMEAMASGLPVVSTLHSGIPELVQDGITGLLVPERDPEALAGALRRLAAAPEQWGEMGRKGRAVVEQEYNERLLNDRLAERLAALADPRQ